MPTTDTIYNAISRINAETFKGVGTPLIRVPADEISLPSATGATLLSASHAKHWNPSRRPRARRKRIG